MGTRRKIAVHMTANSGSRTVNRGAGRLGEYAEAGQPIGKTLLPSPANIRIVTEWYRSGNGKDKEGMKKTAKLKLAVFGSVIADRLWRFTSTS